MKLDDFDFDLPEDLIALRPVRPRTASGLLVSEGGRITDSTVSALSRYLRPDDLLVLNDTRVIPGRLHGTRTRPGGGTVKVEATLISAEPEGRWRALARPGKRLAHGDKLEFGPDFSAVVESKEGAEIVLSFPVAGEAFDRALDAAGNMPLPPYISARRPADEKDLSDYQTVFAAKRGAVAAPTASLHFDQDLLTGLSDAGVRTARVTLHVGAGTFLPVKVENIEEHRMHSEWGSVGQEAADLVSDTRARGGRVIPVGTTSLRVLETAALSDGCIRPWTGETDIFIRPGYRFGVTDGLMTNFHLPKSTLLMLVSALVGTRNMQRIYAHAIAHRYRFFSYGDSSLLFPGDAPGCH